MRTVYFCEESRGIKYFLEAVTPRFANCLGSQGSLAKKTGWWWPQCRGRERGGPATPPAPVPGEVAGREQRGAGTAR